MEYGVLSVFCAGVRTGDRLVDMSSYLRQRFPDMTVGEVFCAPGQETLGVVDGARVKETTLPWANRPVLGAT
jgi:hypothetical protein